MQLDIAHLSMSTRGCSKVIMIGSLPQVMLSLGPLITVFNYKWTITIVIIIIIFVLGHKKNYDFFKMKGLLVVP